MGWSDKYKRSIDCNNPKGFSQKAHCAGRKIRKENMKLSELKDTIRDLIQERSVNAISKAQQKNREDIARALELYKKAKGGNKSYNEKNLIKVLKKLGQDKKKLEKEMDDKISSLYKNADYKGPIDESAEDAGRGVIPGAVKMKLQKAMDVLGGKKLNYMQKIKVLGKVIDSLGIDKKDLQRISQRIKSKLNEYEAYVAYATKGNKIVKTVRDSEYNDKLFSKFKKDMERKGLKVYIDLVKNRKAVRQVYRTNESINEGPSREEFRIAAMAIKKQAKFRNVSPEQAIQDQLNALKLLQRYIKKGDVKKYTGMNLSESKIQVGKVYDNPYHTAFKSPEQIKEEDDHEVGMGLSSLKSSVRSAKVIYDNIKKRNIEELDGWVQEKLTLASDYLKNVADYMEDLDEYDKDGNNN